MMLCSCITLSILLKALILTKSYKHTNKNYIIQSCKSYRYVVMKHLICYLKYLNAKIIYSDNR